jgi:hypothetical protein
MQSTVECPEDFMAMVKVIEKYGGAGLLTYFPNMFKKELKILKADVTSAMPGQKKEA